MALIQDQLAILSGGRDRRGGPIITFPATGRREKAKPEDYRLLLQYLMSIPNEDVAAMGFTVIVDMRGNTTWNSVKPILKVLQESFAMHVHTAHIIKPDNFWQKQRTSLGSQKYKFETNLISTEALLKVLEPTQLTRDLDGSLLYDHSIWIELRCVSGERLTLRNKSEKKVVKSQDVNKYCTVTSFDFAIFSFTPRRIFSHCSIHYFRL